MKIYTALPPGLQPIFERLAKFSAVGIVVTLLSMTATFVLLKFVGTPLIITYVGVYGSTILLSYFLNRKYTFKASHSLLRSLLYFSIYLSSMGLGVLLLNFYESQFSFENWVYPFMAIPFTMSWNFLWASRLLRD